MELGSKHLEKMAVFFGIDKYDCVVAEGLDIVVWPVEELLDKAKVTQVARTF